MRKKALTVLVTLLISILTFGQSTEIENLILKGIEFHDNGEYKKAIEIYQKALSIDPNSSLANTEIAISYYYDKDYKNAEIYSKKAIDLGKDNLIIAYITYGNSLDIQGQTKKAIKCYKKAMRDYDHYLLYYNYAIACFNSGKTDEAYDAVIKAINNNNSHASSHLLLSEIMIKKGSRIKAMLPLYFFLLLEPNSERSAMQYQTLINLFNYGVSKTSDSDTSININVFLPNIKDEEFASVEVMISMIIASNSIEKNKGKSDLELFAQNNESLFNMIGELKNDNSGFWWDFYVSFFCDMTNKNLTKPFSYYISLSEGEKAKEWLESNNEEFEKLKNWASK